MRKIGLLALGAAVAMGAMAAQAANIGVIPTKYIVVDKQSAASKSKAVFVSKDQAAGITKGTGTDVADISVSFSAVYDAETANYALPAGASNGTIGWLVNKDTVAKFVNKDAPAGATSAKVGVIKPGKLLKLVGKDQGDSDILDIFAAGAPSGSVFTAYCVTNGGDENCHCSEFTGCAYKLIAADSGAKLVCKGGVGDPTCVAAGPGPSLFTYSVTTTAAGGACGETRDDDGGGGAQLKVLTCGGLNIGGGAATVPEGPTPDGATNIFNASCVGDACTLSAATAVDTGSGNNCTDTGCKFGTFLSISNGPLSTCVDNSFATPGTGTLDTSTGEVSTGIPLTSVVTVTGNAADPCPPCSGAPGPGVCDASAANPGAACTGVNATGDSYDCDPAGSTLPGFSVDLTPASTAASTVASDPGGLFCPSQVSAGCFADATCEYIEANGTAAGAVTAGVGHSLTLASVFCIPKTGNVLVNGAADLPGPGEVSLPMAGLLAP
jgi:hypothetical protein